MRGEAAADVAFLLIVRTEDGRELREGDRGGSGSGSGTRAKYM